MRRFAFVNRLRLGDCYWHCLYLRKLAIANPDCAFSLHCKPEHHWQLNEVVFDIPSITLETLDAVPQSAIDCWIGEKWYSHPNNMDVIAFLIEWFAYMSDRCGLGKVIHARHDMLADYPLIRRPKQFNTLVVNSYPQSGQFGFNKSEMDAFVCALSKRGSIVTTEKVQGFPCTCDNKMSLSDIASISNEAQLIVAVSTGPSWGIFNRVNYDRGAEIHVMLKQQRLNYGKEIPHYDTLDECRKALE